ncbi:nitrate- and nitrite sensing domain-containing protein [Dactylosporangium sp. NPDC005555]|uniref:sensor histidine kinase n=1 Tax=Dactylosporangium sp. NPDC005555 TaxID=3154889 RepID=UPI0033B5BDE2
MIGLQVAHIQADRVSRRSDADRSDPPKAPGRRRDRKRSIKRRVIRLVLVPSVVAVLLWLVASGYLVFQGFYNRAVASSVRQVSIPAVSALASIQQERRLSIAYLVQPSKGLQQLLDQRQQTDRRLTTLRSAADSALALAPQSIVTRWTTLTQYLDQLPSVRSTIDSRSADEQRAYGFYNELLDAATSLFDNQARVVPDVKATQGGIAATEVFRVSDLMSRAGSTIDGAFGSGAFSQQEYLQFVSLVGAYHSGLESVAPHLQPKGRQRYEAVTAGDSWKELVAVENALITGGPWRSGVPRGLPADKVRWETLTRQVSDALIDLTVVQADEVSTQALRTGNNQMLFASVGSLIALSIAIGAILWAIRQSQVLVDQALSVRLARLGSDAAEVVDKRLPAMMDRLRRREQVDLTAELPFRDFGDDEIGQVAAVINRSLQAAAAAAVDEAKTRAASVAMLMGVARRPQRPLQHGLKVVEDMQNRVADEQLLAQLFDVNHQLTQTRRFLENLVILSGGQIGRRFKNPVALHRVLQAAFAETQQYQRITLRGAPDVSLVGPAVAGTVHLLAELLDNALVFSSPETTVWVTCNEVRHGVAVEIEDAGMGMHAEAVEQANELLATAPTPDITDLKDGAQVGLHVVAELAKREGVQVTLRRSAYGGLLAIVLLPDRVITADSTEPTTDRRDVDVRVPATVASADAPQDPRRHELLAVAAAGMTSTNGSASYQALLHTGGRRSNLAGDPMGDQLPSQNSNSGVGYPSIPESPVADAMNPAAPGPQVAGRPPLPHRQPQQHIAHELRDELAPGADTPPEVSARDPEEAQRRYRDYQRGRAAGLTAGTDDTVTGADQGREA